MAEVVHANRNKVASESNGERNGRAMAGGWVEMMSCRVPLTQSPITRKIPLHAMKNPE